MPESDASQTTHPVPKAGSFWFNTKRKELFVVMGMVAPCDESEGTWQVLYRSLQAPTDSFRRRSLEEWYGINRFGQPRFLETTPEMLSKLLVMVQIVSG